MLRSNVMAAGIAIGITLLDMNVAHAQDYPNKPIRIVTSNAGGGNDVITRVIAQGLTDSWHQPVIVDNRPAGPLPGQLAAKATPDGYTLLVASSTLWIGPLLQKDQYNPVSDFAPIVALSRVPNVLVVYPSVPAKSAKELIALAKAKPGELNYASGPTGGGSHLAVELFKYMAGVNIVRVAYKGASASLPDLLAGRVQLTIDDVPSLMPNVKLGKLTALGITSAQPSVQYPDLPTVAATGLPGYESGAIQGVMAPAKIPEPIARRINQEIVRVLRMPEVKEKLLSLGYETIGNSPGEFAATVKAEVDRMEKVVAAINLHPD